MTKKDFYIPGRHLNKMYLFTMLYEVKEDKIKRIQFEQTLLIKQFL